MLMFFVMQPSFDNTMFYSFDSLILVYGKYTLKQVSIETLGIYNVMVDIELVYHNRAYFTAECFS